MRPRRPIAREQLFHVIASKTIRTTSKEAELAKLFTNTWRYMKFAIANQFFMIADQAGRRLHERPAGDPRGLPARRGPARPGLRRRSVPVQGHDAAVRVHDRPLPDGPGGDAGQRGPAAYIVSALQRRYGGLDGKTVGILGMAFKAESDDTRASLSYKLRKLLAWAGARCSAPTRTSRTTARPARAGARARATSWSSARRTRRTGARTIGGKDVVDVWGALGGGIRL